MAINLILDEQYWLDRYGFRRSDQTAGFVKLPDKISRERLWQIEEYEEGVYYDTQEGGTEFWLIVPSSDNPESIRNKLCTGFAVGIMAYNVVGGWLAEYLNDHPIMDERFPAKTKTFWERMPYVECAICIGATGRTLVSKDGYWEPTYEDLTEEGKTLYRLIAQLYGEEPRIAVVIDT